MLCVVNVQVKLPGLQSRFDHTAAAFILSPGVTEVTIFGGCPEWPNNYRSAADLSQIAITTVLRFGEYTSCVCIVSCSQVVIILWVICMEVVLALGPPLVTCTMQGALHRACHLYYVLKVINTIAS